MFENHPCFNAEKRHTSARVHLPVAPSCNIQCNFCNRKYDCVNENRPGVSSVILHPAQALNYLDSVLERTPNVAVAGIAGPGDPFTTPDKTLETLQLVHSKYPDLLLCLASNGLNVADYVPQIAELKVSHVTFTVNAVKPEIGAQIYSWIRFHQCVLRGIEGAGILLKQQTEAIKKLKERNITVKINTVVIPGINDNCVEDIAKYCAGLGADIQNCMPLLPVKDTPFESLTPLTQNEITSIRKNSEKYLSQMNHCARCRADAVGLIGIDNSSETEELLRNAAVIRTTAERPNVAVASMEGYLVNKHLGESETLLVFGETNEGNLSSSKKIVFKEKRETPQKGLGDKRWELLAESFKDCAAVLVSGCGRNPQQILERKGLRVITMEGFISEALPFIFNGKELPKVFLRSAGCGRGMGCAGSGSGCG
ncbi:MAG: radical SAM protein [Planctomycetaceae bacterium]|jgi:nitrogen fixation protein NifB|nr:radical SAM protein [Planctomycetaceae bacterium]